MALLSSVFSCFFCKHVKPAARGRTCGPRNKKPGAACRPGSWRGFGEYLFLEDSRYTIKRKIELLLSRSISTGSRLTLRGWLTRYLALHRGQLVIGYPRGGRR